MDSKEELSKPISASSASQAPIPLPEIQYARNRLEEIIEEVSLSDGDGKEITEYLNAIDSKVDKIKKYQLKTNPEDFYTLMQACIDSIKDVAESLYRIIDGYDSPTVISLKKLMIQWFAPFEAELKRRLAMSPEARKELELKTKRLYAQQSFVARSPVFQQALMQHIAEIASLFRKPGEPLPRCYISYAWPSDNNKEKEYWVQPFLYILYEHLKAAGIDIVMDIRDCKKGDSIYGFMNQYNDGNHIITIGTESLRQKHLGMTTAAVQTELNIALKKNDEDKGLGRGVRIYPLLISGTIEDSFPDGYRMYENILDGREGFNVSYLELIENLVTWLNYNKLNKNQDSKLKEAYKQKWYNFYELYKSQGGLSNQANSTEIEKELEQGFHKGRVDHLRQNLRYKSLEVQEKAEYNTKSLLVFIDSDGISQQKLWDAAGKQYQRPTPNPHFIPRQDLHGKINEHFKDNEQQILILTAHGMGGMGKTELASHYFQHPPHPYTIRAWFNAGSREQIYQQYLDLIKRAENIEYPKEIPIEEMAQLVKQWLERQKDCLLVFDNVERAQDLTGLLPEQGKHHILITSRNAADLSLGPTVNVDVMTENEAIDLVVEIAGGKDKNTKLDYKEKNLDALKELVKTLGYLPLALAQAASYIRETPGADIKWYLEIYNNTKYKNKEELLKYQAESLGSSKHEPVWITFDINFKALEKDYPNALSTLKQSSWLASSNIPEILLASMMQTADESRDVRLLWNDISKQLSRYSLMLFDAEKHSVNIHPLLQEILRSKQTEEEQIEIFKYVCNTMDEMFKNDTTYSLNHRIFLPHAETLHRHSEHIAELATKNNHAHAEPIKINPVCLGTLYIQLGSPNEAKEYYEQALAIEEQHFGRDHFQTALTLRSLGNVYRKLGNPNDAKKYLERALAIQEQYFGKGDFQTAPTLRGLGNVYSDLGMVNEAKEYYEQALAIEEKHFGRIHFETARTLANLGVVCRKLGDLDKAKEYYEQSLEVQENHFGKGHFETAPTLANLGNVYNSLGNSNEAKKYLERALAIKTQRFGKGHFETAPTLVNLGLVYSKLGDSNKAKEYYEQSLAIQEKHFSKGHFQTAPTLVNLGSVYSELGDLDKAKEYLLRAKEICTQQRAGQQHLSKIEDLLNKINMKIESNNANKQNLVAHSVLESSENSNFLYDYATNAVGVWSIYMLTKGLAKTSSCNQNEDIKAKASNSSACTKKESNFDSYSIRNDMAALNLKYGLSCFDKQKYIEAKLYLQEAYNIRVQLLGDNHEETLQAKLCLEKCDEKLNIATIKKFNSQSVYNKTHNHVDRNKLTPAWSSQRMLGYPSQNSINKKNVTLRITDACIAENSREVLDSYRSIENYNNWQVASFLNRIFKENIVRHIHQHVTDNFYNKLKRIVYR